MNNQSKLGIVAHTCDPCTYEAEAGELPEVRDQPRQQNRHEHKAEQILQFHSFL